MQGSMALSFVAGLAIVHAAPAPIDNAALNAANPATTIAILGSPTGVASVPSIPNDHVGGGFTNLTTCVASAQVDVENNQPGATNQCAEVEGAPGLFNKVVNAVSCNATTCVPGT